MTERFLIVALISSAAYAAQNGLPARSSPNDYPSRAVADGMTVAAHVLDDSEVQSGFATELYKKYAVVEVAVYPAAGKSIAVSDVDFGLKYDGKTMPTRAASPQTVAGALHRRAAAPKKDIVLYPSVGVGVDNGPYGTGTTTGGGVGVGIGNAPPQPGSTREDREVMRTELEEKALPSGTVSKPVAGYLYFPLPLRKHVVAQELVFEHEGRTVRLSLKAEKSGG